MKLKNLSLTALLLGLTACNTVQNKQTAITPLPKLSQRLPLEQTIQSSALIDPQLVRLQARIHHSITSYTIKKEVKIKDKKIIVTLDSEAYLDDVENGILLIGDKKLHRKRAKILFSDNYDAYKTLIRNSITPDLPYMKKVTEILTIVSQNVTYCPDKKNPYLQTVATDIQFDYQKSPLQTLIDGTGDCDDYMSLALRMLEVANIHAHGALVKTRTGHHAIVAVPISNEHANQLKNINEIRKYFHQETQREEFENTLVYHKPQDKYYLLYEPQTAQCYTKFKEFIGLYDKNGLLPAQEFIITKLVAKSRRS